MQPETDAASDKTNVASMCADDLLCGTFEDVNSRSLLTSSKSKASVVLRIEAATSADTKVGGKMPGLNCSHLFLALLDCTADNRSQAHCRSCQA